MRLVSRVLIVVCDSFGVGDAPDAEAYGDEGSDTLGNTAKAVGGIVAPNLGSLGLGVEDFGKKLVKGGAFIDVKAAFDPEALKAAGYTVWRL